MGICSLLIVATTALMIGTIAQQRASDLIRDPTPAQQQEAVRQLRTHSSYITVVAVLAGFTYMSLLAGSVTKRVNVLRLEDGTRRSGEPFGKTLADRKR